MISKGVTNQGRFIGAHFFSPVPRMELLEIIKGESTTPDTVYSLQAFAAAIKKRPLICKDSPGFVVNALLLPYFQKAFWLLEHGVPIEAIYGAMVKMGMPVGPIRLVEEVGIDVPYNAFRAMGLNPPKTIENMVKNGRLGFKKSGQGFFTKCDRGTVFVTGGRFFCHTQACDKRTVPLSQRPSPWHKDRPPVTGHIRRGRAV